MVKKKKSNRMSKKMQKRKVARTNTKLLTLVIAIGGVIILGLGGLWYFVEYRGPARNVKSGDAYFAEGSFKNARKQYGRAVTKEPTNLVYLDKLQKAILAMTPVTPAEARAAYDEYIRTLIHSSRYNPLSIDAHLIVADEMYMSAFMTGLDENWRRLYSVSENGLNSIAVDDPRRSELLLYRGLASLRLEDASMTDTYDDDGNVRFPGEDDFETVLEKDPGNPMAWAALLHGRMAVYYRLKDEGKTKQAERNFVFANETMDRAINVAGERFEVSAVVLRELLLQRTTLLQKLVANPNDVPQEELDAVNEKIVEARDVLATAYDPVLHFARAGEIASLLNSTNADGKEVAASVLQSTVEEHPDDFGRKYMLAGLLLELDRVDEAITISEEVLKAENQTVGLHAIELFSIRPLFAQLLVRIYVDKSKEAEDETKQVAFIDVAKVYRTELYDLMSSKDDHQFVLYVDGIIALAEKKYAQAAQKLQETIQRNPNVEARVYRQAAFALSQSNARGLALEFLRVAIKKEPSNLGNYLAKAQLEIELSEIDDAIRTLAVLPEQTRQREDVQELLNIIALHQSSTETTAFSDEILRYIALSEQLTKKKEYDEAEAALKEAMELAAEPDWRLFVAHSNLYYNMGNQEEAVVWIKKAIEIAPNPDSLMPKLHLLETDNRVEALIALVESQEESDVYKAEELAVSLYELAVNSLNDTARFLRLGDTAEAESSKETSELAFIESERYQALAESLGADLSRIIGLRINDAIERKEFTTANTHIESLIESGATEDTVAAARISLHVAQAIEARQIGKLELVESNLNKALTLAEKRTEENSISDVSWRQLGLVLTEMKQLEEAINAYAEAYRISPRNKENIRAYVAVLMYKPDESQRLLRVLRQANTQYPNDSQFRSGWLAAEKSFGDLSKVLVFRMNHAVFMPGDRVNKLELASLFTNTEPRRDLLRDLEGKEYYTARVWEQMSPQNQETVLGDARKSWDRDIENTLEELSTTPDANERVAKLHASVHRDNGQMDRASEIWDKYISSVEETDGYITGVIAAADFLQQSGRAIQAVQVLENAQSAQSELYEIDGVLGSLYYVLGRYEEAASMLKLPVQATKNNVLHSRMIESLALSGQFNEAEEAIGTFRTTNTAYAKAMLRALISRIKSEQLLAQGDLANGTAELEKYRNALRQAIMADFMSQTAYMQLCRSLLNEYRLTQNKALLEEALGVVDEARAAGNQSEQFEIVRADVLQADGQLNRSIDLLSRHLAEKPTASLVRQRLIEAYLDSDNIDRALAAANAGVELDPSSPVWHQRLGDLHIRANNDVGKGVQSYLAAMQRDPNVQLLFRIDEVTRTTQSLPNQELLEMARGPIAKMHPVVRAIEAKALQNLGRNRDALIAMKNSWNMFQHAISKSWISPQSMSAWYLDMQTLFMDNPEAGEKFIRELVGDELSQVETAGLAGYYRAFGNEHVDHAIELINAGLQSEDGDQDSLSQLLMMRGGFLVEEGRFDESEETFKRLADETQSPLVKNNLAYVIGVYQNRPAEALEIAKEAATEAPREPSIVDTVAMLYCRLGQYEQAAKAFDFLLQLDPTNTRAMAKLSLLYADEFSDPERGLYYAERGRSQNPRSAEVLDAIGWSYYRMGKNEQAEESIRRSLRQGDTMEAYLHLAQIVTDDEKYEEALGHLRMAEELAEDTYSMERIQSLKDDIRKKKRDS